FGCACAQRLAARRPAVRRFRMTRAAPLLERAEHLNGRLGGGGRGERRGDQEDTDDGGKTKKACAHDAHSSGNAKRRCCRSVACSGGCVPGWRAGAPPWPGGGASSSAGAPAFFRVRGGCRAARLSAAGR